MNVFAVSAIPGECAQALDDRRLVKMVLETAQLLSTAVRLTPVLAPGVDPEALYRATHRNHPVALWVRADPRHFAWTRRLLPALIAEYGLRFGKSHACGRIAGLLPAVPAADPEAWCNCTPHPEMETFAAYRAYLGEKWAADHPPPTWRKRGPPGWWNGDIREEWRE